MNEHDDPYKVLGVSSTTSDGEIKKAYRKLALKHHPDKQTTQADKEKAQSVFAKIANAYEILSDPEEREQYDLRKKYGGAPGTRYTTTSKSPNSSGSSPQYSSNSPQYTSTSSTNPRTSTTRRTSTPSGGPARAQYSQKGGKFTATVTKEDGTTYTFMGSANGFQDPYEVFRKAFQDKTGEELPEGRMKPQQRRTSNNMPLKKTSMPSTPGQKYVPVKTSTRTSTKIEGGMKIITKTETLSDGRTRTSVEKIPMDDAPRRVSSTQKAQPEVHPSWNGWQNDAPQPPPQRVSTTQKSQPVMTRKSQPVMRKSHQPTMMMKSPMRRKSHQQPMKTGGGATPMGRSQRTRQVHHSNGQVETITEITETLSDGTTRTSSSSKFSTVRQ